MDVLSRTSITTASHAFLSTAAPRSMRASCRGVTRRGRDFNVSRVEVAGCDVPLDRGRNLACDRSPLPDVPADGAGRNVRSCSGAYDHLLAAEPRRIEILALPRADAGSRHHHNLGQLADLVRLVPAPKQPGGGPTPGGEQLPSPIAIA